MDNRFFEQPILNSPYEYPTQHWELDDDGQPTQRIINKRRRVEFITPIPMPRKRKGSVDQQKLIFDEGKGLSTVEQQYDPTSMINQIRPFFCQIEAVETVIWLTEVAPNFGKIGKDIHDYLVNANNDANPELMRIAVKLATGAGKTTIMAMLIAWQTINAIRRPTSPRFTRGFLVVTPGITIRDRLRVLQPNDPDSYYASRELIPNDMLGELERAKIIITNFHAFKLRERTEISKGGRSLLQGRGAPLNTLETEGQMLQRVMPELMGMKKILVLNDEAHHCYREKPQKDDEGELKGDDREEAEKNNEAARLWISGLEAVKRKLGMTGLFDLSRLWRRPPR